MCEESLAIFWTEGGKRGIAYALRLTGRGVWLQGDFERAAGPYREGLALFRDLETRGSPECIEGLAIIASAQGNPERAERLVGAAGAAGEKVDFTMSRPERAHEEKTTTREELVRHVPRLCEPDGVPGKRPDDDPQ